MSENINENILRIRQKISKAALKSGRRPEDVKLIAAVKKVPVEKIMEAIDAGVIDIGENRVQDAVVKFSEIGNLAKWHFIGHLQRNKVKYIVPFTEIIHSVDSFRLAFEINKQAKKINKIQKIFLEVNISGEESKFGFSSNEILEKLKEMSELKNISIEGLMTLPPMEVEKEAARKFFKRLRDIFENIKIKKIPHVNMSYLSMGMTNDFEIAIEEGANMVRIGTGIFGFREVKE